jgi:UDP-glucose 4-epimerase
MKTKKVLVTGAKGFIGSHLLRRLTETGNVVVSTTSKNQTRLDITDMNDLQCIEEVEAIVHLAAKSSDAYSNERPYETYYTNVFGTLNLLELCKQKNIQKFVFISTYAYGQPKYLPIDERHQLDPHTPYRRSKLLAEQLCESYSNVFGINIVTLRPFYVYGPGARNYSFISSAIQQIKMNRKVVLSGEHTTRDLLFIDDFIKLLEAILNKFPGGYNVYNVGSGINYTLKEVSQMLAQMLNEKITIEYNYEMRPNDITNMIADISKVSNAFNWKPSIDLQIGLRSTVENSINL